MFSPEYLKKGDLVGVVSPAGRTDKKFIDNTVEHFESRGLKVVIGKNALSKWNQFAGTDVQRVEDFQNFIDNKNIKAIFCSRGGYGSIRIIDHIDFSTFIKYPKWIVGYSDITVFHLFINNNLNFASMHGPMPVNFPVFPLRNASLNSILDLISGKNCDYTFPHHPLNRIGTAEGEVTGGNLSIIYSLRGTVYDFDFKDKILFIEDIGEQLYHLDRIMMNLKLGNKFSGLKGLIVGQFNKMKDNKTRFGFDQYEIINNHIKDFDFPVCYNFPAGHIKKNLTIPFGTKLFLRVRKNGCQLEY